MSITRHFPLPLALLLSIAAPSLAAAADELTIARLSGSVEISAKGKPLGTRVGTKLAAPLKVVTGEDGSVRLEHASTALDIGPNSVVVIPNSSRSTLDKIQQQVGRVLYSVKPRKTRPLVVETPYLVSVVKGTTFSVAVENETATIALLEGSLLISGNGVDEDVLLAPNQSATRAQGERVISVTTVDATPPALPPQANMPAPLPASAPLDPGTFASNASNAMVASDLADITAAYTSRAMPAPQPTPTIPPPTPGPDTTPAPPAPTPVPPAPEPIPQPDTVPGPGEDDDSDYGDDDDDNSGPGNADDDDDDGNDGHGDDDDSDDDSNPAVTPTLPPVAP